MKMFSKEFKLHATNVKKNTQIFLDVIVTLYCLYYRCLRASGEIGREYN